MLLKYKWILAINSYNLPFFKNRQTRITKHTMQQTRHRTNPQTTQRPQRKCLTPLLLFCTLFFLCLGTKGHAQNVPDSVTHHQLPEINIGGDYFSTGLSPAAIQTITAKQLSNLPTLQLSDALKYMSGIVIKDYGGAGGMKTVSIRGLGSQHTGVSYDGIMLTDCQTGQIDLSKLSLDNVASVSVISGLNSALTPARHFSYSNLIKIQTFHNLPQKPIHLKVAFTGGSFGLISPQFFFENLIRSKKNKDRYFLWNLSGNYLQSKGDYPFTLHYGGNTDSVSHERRQNADVRSFNTELNLLYKPSNRQTLQAKWYYYDAERGLPSATVLYNLESHQRLANRNTFGQINYLQQFSPKWTYLVCGKFNYDYTHYIDPQYLNTEGKLDNIYEQYEGYISNAVKYSPLYKHNGWHIRDNPVNLHISLANDLFFNQLEGNSLDYLHPKRFTSMTDLSVLYYDLQIRVSGNLLLTTVNNYTDNNIDLKNYVHASPALNFQFTDKSLHWIIRAFYKNIFRMPTFNDLFYREVGNLYLEPEKTHQWDLGFAYHRNHFYNGKMDFSANLDGYFNIVKDKIVAFPSQNLFSWTMLNYGKVWIGGAEINANWQYQFVKRYFIRLNGNCTCQKAVDRTDSTGKTFNHQIPYTPVWSGSASASVETPWFTIAYSIIASGKRYALGENIPANLVNGYLDQSITLGHEFDIKKVKLGIKFELLNIANAHYEIIRNYPMQGRNFRLKVWFSY